MIYSNTIVRNGKPFIEPVLRRVEPFVDGMIVTVSHKSTDGTIDILEKLENEFPKKIQLSYEDVPHPGLLTEVRQSQLNYVPLNSWVLFLDDDDWWPEESLEDMKMYLDLDVDGYGVMPWQLMSPTMYDGNWKNKYFTKFFKKTEGVHYERPWPRDLIFKGTEMLYWKTNPRVPKVPIKFFHLSYLKNHSFRSEDWAKEFSFTLGNPTPLPEQELKRAKEIYDYLRT